MQGKEGSSNISRRSMCLIALIHFPWRKALKNLNPFLKKGHREEIITQTIYLTCAKEKEQFLPSAHDHRVILREVCYSSHAVFLFLLAPKKRKVVCGRERFFLPPLEMPALWLGWERREDPPRRLQSPLPLSQIKMQVWPKKLIQLSFLQ